MERSFSPKTSCLRHFALSVHENAKEKKDSCVVVVIPSLLWYKRVAGSRPMFTPSVAQFRRRCSLLNSR